jgi:hypothetical protein
VQQQQHLLLFIFYGKMLKKEKKKSKRCFQVMRGFYRIEEGVFFLKEKEKKRRKISVIPLVMCSLLSVCVLERNDWSSGTPSRFGAPPQSLDLVHHFNPFTINYSINNNKTKQNKKKGR